MGIKSVCVFAGSSFGNHQDYRAMAELLGKTLAQRGCRIIYGGSKSGLMGAMADAALSAGGEVVGVMPTGLIRGETAHSSLTQFFEVKDMHTRKAKMAELSDGFIALPGGFGTYEELFEVLCWAQIGIHQKPIGVLNVQGYYDPIIALARASIEAGFVKEGHLSLINVSGEPEELIQNMVDYVPAITEKKWNKST